MHGRDHRLERHRIVEMTSSSLTHSWFNRADADEETDYSVGSIVAITVMNTGKDATGVRFQT